MTLPFFIARRHLFSRHKIGYISFISIISIVGLAVGIAALILTISILNGFEQEVRLKLIGFDAHIRLRLFGQDVADPADSIRVLLGQQKEIRYIAPYIHRQAIIRHGSETDGVVVEGIRLDDIRMTLNLERFLVKGQLQFDTEQGLNGIVLGQKLADYLGVDVGDKVYLFEMRGGSSLGGRSRISTFDVTGLYDSGISDYDDIFVYMSLKAAQEMFAMGDSFSGFQMMVVHPEKAPEIAAEINDQLGYPYRAMSWTELHQNLFEWLRVQRFPILIVFGLIAVVAIFNIVSSLMMIVIEKTRDIGILKSMGVNRKQVTFIFTFEGLLVGIAGTLLGYLLALALAWLQIRFGIISIPEDVYFMSQLPILLDLQNFLIVGCTAIFFALIATIYPALKANQLSPVEATRYE
jgi:lipoprotein-releasing system permease protein